MARLDLDPVKVREFAKAEAAKDVVSVMYRVEALAKLAAKGTHPLTTDSTGRLSRSIKSDLSSTATKVVGRVGVDRYVKYALAAHDGAVGHRIHARRVRALHFHWKRIGETVYLGSVKHPGMRGKKYLTGPLFRVAVPRGYKVVVYGTYVTYRGA